MTNLHEFKGSLTPPPRSPAHSDSDGEEPPPYQATSASRAFGQSGTDARRYWNQSTPFATQSTAPISATISALNKKRAEIVPWSLPILDPSSSRTSAINSLSASLNDAVKRYTGIHTYAMSKSAALHADSAREVALLRSQHSRIIPGSETESEIRAIQSAALDEAKEWQKVAIEASKTQQIAQLEISNEIAKRSLP